MMMMIGGGCRGGGCARGGGGEVEDAAAAAGGGGRVSELCKRGGPMHLSHVNTPLSLPPLCCVSSL